MRIAVFDTHAFDRDALTHANQDVGHDLQFFDVRLDARTAALAEGCEAVSAFVNDRLDADTLKKLVDGGTTVVALRCAGFDQVDLAAAAVLGVRVMRVPAYSPHAVAEHAVALLLCLDRKLHRAHARVREGNFDLTGLVGFDLFGKTVGVLGTGTIGQTFARIMHGFGCRVLLHDLNPDKPFADSIGATYVPLRELWPASDVVSLHLPLSPATRHVLGVEAIQALKPGAIVLNTGRGGLVDTVALIEGLKRGQIGGAGLDVYEGEAGVFFTDHSAEGLHDDVLARLLTLPNVLVTGHQAFLTREALAAIAATTLQNVTDAAANRPSANDVTVALPQPPRP